MLSLGFVAAQGHLTLTFGLSSPDASLSFSEWELSPIRSEARTRPVL